MPRLLVRDRSRSPRSNVKFEQSIQGTVTVLPPSPVIDEFYERKMEKAARPIPTRPWFACKTPSPAPSSTSMSSRGSRYSRLSTRLAAVTGADVPADQLPAHDSRILPDVPVDQLPAHASTMAQVEFFEWLYQKTREFAELTWMQLPSDVCIIIPYSGFAGGGVHVGIDYNGTATHWWI